MGSYMKKITPRETRVEKESQAKPTVKEIEPMTQQKVVLSVPVIIIACAIIVAGGFTGYVLASGGNAGAKINSGKTSSGLAKEVGVMDEKTFKDNAEGILREGGVEDGEGTHHLERPGGPSQNIYLTSSVVPLDDYIDKKVKIWGQTFDPGAAGWFMDVGRLELLE